MSFWGKVKLFFSPMKANYFGYFLLFSYSVMIAFANIYFVIFLENVAKAVENTDMDAVVYWSIGLGILALSNYLLRLFLKPQHFKLRRDGLNFLEREYFAQYLQLDNNESEKVGTGRFIAIVKKGLDIWMEELNLLFRDKTILLVGIIVSLIYIAESSIVFLFYILGLIVVAIPWIGFFGKKALGYRRQSKDVLVEGNRVLVRWLMSKFEILQQGKYSYEVEKKYNLWRQWYDFKFREKVRQGLGFDTIVFLTKLFVVFIAFFVGKGAIEGIYTLSDFVLLTGLGGLVAKNLFTILQQIRRSIDNLVHIEKLRDAFEGIGLVEGYETGDEFIYKTGAIDVNNITYSYGDKPVFQNFSLEIKAGKKSAFVGLSGAGKSTLVKLLSGYLQVNDGSILVDEQDLSSVSLKTYYQNIGYLTQEPSVFDGSIRENLMYSLPSGISLESIQDRVDKALKESKCDFIYDLPNGVDTEIGERGIRLSGGQKQRLAIAKIFLKDPKIIILDEPTSALDSFSEEAITDAMHNLYDGRTVLIIAHRLQTVKEADEIFVLDYNEKAQSSEVIEHGTHDELVSKKGFYATMLEVQTGF